MGLAVRIIPTLLMRGPHLVKGKQFSGDRVIGSVLQAVRIHNMRGVDELILMDVGATPEGRGPDFKLIEAITRDCFCPITVGGGVRSVQDVRDLLSAGADKAAICSEASAYDQFKIVRDCVGIVGSQAIVVAVDYVGDEVFTECGTQVHPFDAVEWASLAAKAGAGEILLTSIDREGTMTGYDLDLIRAVSAAVDVPVIAHGGCGRYSDMVSAIRAGANAVAVGALFAFTDATPRDAARFLNIYGLEARV
jgi:cyclase